MPGVTHFHGMQKWIRRERSTGLEDNCMLELLKKLLN